MTEETKSKNLTISLKNIVLPADWNRENLGDIKGLLQSLKTRGQKVAITVRSHPEDANKVILIDGRRRYAALLEAGINDAIISYSEEKDDADAFMTSMIANLVRKGNNPWEISCGFQKSKESGWTVKNIAKACDMSEGSVSQHLAAQRIHKRLQSALKAEKIPLSMVRHFARLTYEEDQVFYDRLIEYALDGMTAQDIGDKVDIFVSKKEKATPKSTGAAKSKKGKGASTTKEDAKSAGKKKPGPKVQVPDYTDEGVRELVKMISKEKALEWMEYYADRLQNTTSAHMRKYNQGVLDGLEIATSLIVEE